MTRATAEMRELAKQYAPDALETLRKIASGGESEAARVSAANAILDRGYGKPGQSVEFDTVAGVKFIIEGGPA